MFCCLLFFSKLLALYLHFQLFSQLDETCVEKGHFRRTQNQNYVVLRAPRRSNCEQQRWKRSSTAHSSHNCLCEKFPSTALLSCKREDEQAKIMWRSFVWKIISKRLRADLITTGFLVFFVLSDHCENLDHSVRLEGSWSMMCKELSDALTRRLKGG